MNWRSILGSLMPTILVIIPVYAQYTGHYQVGGYFPDWAVYNGYQLENNPQLAKLNAVYFAFMIVASDGSLKFEDTWSDLNPTNDRDKLFCSQFRYSCPNLSRNGGGLSQFSKFADAPVSERIVSVGGGGQSGVYAYAFKYPNQFVKSLKALVQIYGITGIDLDYEPSSLSSSNLANLIKLTGIIKAALPGFTVSYPIMSSPNWINSISAQNWAKLMANTDYVVLMGYDLFGPWSSPRKTALLSDLRVIENSRQALLAKGLINSQIVLGIPSYGRSVSGVSADGLGQPYSSRAKWGEISYKAISSQAYYNPTEVVVNGQIVGTYTYNPTTLVFTTFDSQASIASKSQWAIDNGLRGVVMWELDTDAPADGSLALINAIGVPQ